MVLFKKVEKAKPQKIVEFSDVEQGLPLPLPVAPKPSPTEAMLAQVLQNQATIVENQQMILNAIGGTQALMRRLAGAEEESMESTNEDEEAEEEEEEEAPKAIPKTVVKKKAK